MLCCCDRCDDRIFTLSEQMCLFYRRPLTQCGPLTTVTERSHKHNIHTRAWIDTTGVGGERVGVWAEREGYKQVESGTQTGADCRLLSLWLSVFMLLFLFHATLLVFYIPCGLMRVSLVPSSRPSPTKAVRGHPWSASLHLARTNLFIFSVFFLRRIYLLIGVMPRTT